MDRTKAATLPGNAECSLEDSIHLTRAERRRIFGIDTVESLRWLAGQWAPGGEFICKMSVKNTGPSVLHIKYKLPHSKFFSMRFPKPFTLSPGNHFNLDVTFRPLVYEEYNDFVEFKCEAGMFRIPLSAKLAALEVNVPKSVNFGLCPTNEYVEKKLKIRNTGQMDASFEFRSEAPFSITPARGRVPAGSTFDFTCRFAPTDITVCVQQAGCIINGGESILEMQLVGTGKYAFIQVSESMVDFGNIVVGTIGSSLKRRITLTNHSEVNASFKVRQLEEDHPQFSRFSIQPQSATIPPKSSLDVEIGYKAKFEGRFSCDSFVFQTPGGNAPVIYCKGMDCAPNIRIYKKSGVNRPGLGRSGDRSKEVNSVQFGDVEVGKTSTRVVIVNNNSPLPCNFNFQAEDKGTFSFSKVTGVASSGLETAITVTFRPEYSGNFVRRIYCLLEHGPCQYVDFIGTAFSNDGRPQPIYQRHVDRFLRRAQLGYSRSSPKEIEDLISSSGIMADEIKKPREFAPGVTSSGESSNENIVHAQDFFKRVCNPTNDVLIHEEEIHFGAGSRLHNGPKKIVHVTNKTHDKVVCTWMVPRSDDDDEEKDFVIFPIAADVAAGATVDFAVSFRPSQDNFYYHQEIEAYFYFKSQRNFRLVNDVSFTPPWCKTLRVLGHTFGVQADQFIANIRAHAPRIEFPDCCVGNVVFVTKKFTNNGSTPATFRFKPDPSNIFDMRPTGGMIPAGESALFSIRFRPKQCRLYTSAIDCVFNESTVVSTRLVGLGGKPELSFVGKNGVASGAIVLGTTAGSPRFRKRRRHHINLEDDEHLVEDTNEDDFNAIVGEIISHRTVFFKPTCIGISSTRQCNVRNASRLPLRFQWVVPDYLSEILDIQPREALLRGCEVGSVMLHFSPRREKLHRFKLRCNVYSAGGDMTSVDPLPGAQILQSIYLTIVGEGTSGALEFIPPLVDFQTLLLGTKDHRVLAMKNNSDCNIKYQLQVVERSDIAALDDDGDGVVESDEMQRFTEEKGSSSAQKKREKSIISFSDPSGIIPARSKRETIVTFQPRTQGLKQYRVFWQLLPDNLHKTSDAFSSAADASRAVQKMDEDNPLLFCDVVGNAGHPILAIDDVRSSSGLSTRSLWESFGLDTLNKELKSHLSDFDLAYAQSAPQDPSQLLGFPFVFPAKPLHSAPTTVALKLRNSGDLLVEFELKFSTDMEIEIENWADKGKLTEEENRNAAILAKDLFRVHPRKGCLKAGEEMALFLQYNYTSVDPVTIVKDTGMHELPVVLHVKQGKSMRLMLTGKTLHTTDALLQMDKVNLRTSVPFGHPSPLIPTVYQEIFNPSDVHIEYEIDEAPILELSKLNYGCPVIKCLNPTGTIEPRSLHQIRWACQPLEERNYRLETNLTYRPVGERVRVTHMAKMKLPISIDCQGLPPDQQVLANAAAALSPAPRQAVLAPGQVLVFSHDRVDFGEVPVQTKATRVVVLRNLSGSISGPFSGLSTSDINEENEQLVDTKTACYFFWDTEHYAIKEGLVKIHPPFGKVDPGSHVVVRFTLKAATCAVHLTEMRCVVVPVDPETGELNMGVCANLTQHDRDIVSANEGLNIQTSVHGERNKSNTVDSHVSTNSRAGGSRGTVRSLRDSTCGTERRHSKPKLKRRKSVIIATTGNHQNRMHASRLQAEEAGNTRVLTETERVEARAIAKAKAGNSGADGAGFHKPEMAQAMTLTLQLHARVWHSRFFDQDDRSQFYVSKVPKGHFHNIYGAPKLPNCRVVRKNCGLFANIMNEIVRECVQQPVVETTLLELQRKTRSMPIPLFSELETSLPSDGISAEKGLVAYGPEVHDGDIGEPWRADMAQRVLQNTIYNLTEELLHGRFRLDQVPRVTGGNRKKK